MEHPSSSPPRHASHPVIERFVAACAADARVAAAFLTGSYAAGTADAHSDLDLGVIIADAAYDDFLTSREPFVRLLGEPVFVETFARTGHTLFHPGRRHRRRASGGARERVPRGRERPPLGAAGQDRRAGGRRLRRAPSRRGRAAGGAAPPGRLVLARPLPLRHGVRAWPVVVGVRRAGNCCAAPALA